MRWILFLLLWLIHPVPTLWGQSCEHPNASFERVRDAAFHNPARAMQEARPRWERPRCGLQWALGAYLSRHRLTADEAGMLERWSTETGEAIILESLAILLQDKLRNDRQERLKVLEKLSRSQPPSLRALFLYLVAAEIEDPLLRASLEGEMMEKLASEGTLSAFDRVLLMEYEVEHRKRAEADGAELQRDRLMPLLRTLKLDYWEAHVLYHEALRLKDTGDPSLYLKEAQARFQNVAKDGLYGRILLEAAATEHRKGQRVSAIRLAFEAEPYLKAANDADGLGDLWKSLARFYKDQGRTKAASEAIEKAASFYPATSAWDRNELVELRADVHHASGDDAQAVAQLELFARDFSRLEEEERQTYAREAGLRYGLTLEEERNKIRALNQKTAEDKARMEAAHDQARGKSLRIRLIASLVFFLGAIGLVWIIRRGFALGQAIHSLNEHIENHALERFLPPALVHEVAAGHLQLDERPNTRLVTILAADIVGFTAGTESLGSERIAKILNQFMVVMSNVIFEHQGTIDKFIGDGVIAIFGAPLDMDAETQALQASRCAQAMIKALDALNADQLQGHGWKLRLRVGLHQGVALVGSFGTRQRSDYGVIGDALHIASRVQTVAGPNEVLLTTGVKQHLGSNFCSRRGDLKIRDQSQAIAMHSLSLTAELKAA